MHGRFRGSDSCGACLSRGMHSERQDMWAKYEKKKNIKKKYVHRTVILHRTHFVAMSSHPDYFTGIPTDENWPTNAPQQSSYNNNNFAPINDNNNDNFAPINDNNDNNFAPINDNNNNNNNAAPTNRDGISDPTYAPVGNIQNHSGDEAVGLIFGAIVFVFFLITCSIKFCIIS